MNLIIIRRTTTPLKCTKLAWCVVNHAYHIKKKFQLNSLHLSSFMNTNYISYLVMRYNQKNIKID